MKNQKGFAHLFLIVVIVVIGIGGLLYYSWQRGLIKTTPNEEASPTLTPDETASWETFQNQEYQVKYPKEWFLGPFTSDCNFSPNPNDEGHIIIADFCVPQDPLKSFTGDGVRIEIYPEEYSETTGKNFDTLVNLYNKIFMATPNVTSYPDEEIDLQGSKTIKRVKTVIEEGLAINYYYLFIDRGSKAYIIAYSLNEQSKDKEKTVNQILSTFKFIEEIDVEGKACGGPVLTPCPSGYTCQLSTIKSGELEETSGKCVKNE